MSDISEDIKSNQSIIKEEFTEKISSSNYAQYTTKTESNNFAEIRKRLDQGDAWLKLFHAAMGLVTESGEIMDILKKFVFYSKDFDFRDLIEEVGDLLWYISIICDMSGYSLDMIMQMNIAKLKLRYPEGFKKESAINRNTEKEMEAFKELKKEIIGKNINKFA